MLLYVAGIEYQGVASALAELGHTPIRAGGNELAAIARVDGVVFAPGWIEDERSLVIRAYTEDHQIPIWDAPEYPALHPVEVSCPEQVQAFTEALGAMHRMHLEKNHDYSPANILGTGEVGLVTRLWDKTARLMNLTGFRLTVASCEFETPKIPRYEAIADTYLDLANYAVIGALLRRGHWGK
jgi:hypothetical protein